MNINLQKFNELVNQKYLSVQKHNACDLLIWNYTQKCQFDAFWTEETMMARGLITTVDGHIVARPFKKFFNLGEIEEQHLPIEKFYIQEKFDGSLGILYWIGNMPYIATRGSFTSDQAIRATEMIHKYDWTNLKKDVTYLFEIIYPENRIVVDYGNREELILLAVIDTETGFDLDIYEECDDFVFAGFIDGVADYRKLKEEQKTNKEGYVIRFESGLRVKMKFDEYVRLHRLVTGVNARTIWDLLRNDQPFDELLERVPDEFYEWVKKTKEKLMEEYKIIEMQARLLYNGAETLETRKEQAELAKKHFTSPIVFKMLDKKPYADLIWKMLKPSAEKPFKQEI